eukprot:SAG31_NODE_108_length_24741_cov_6.933041_21_plen_517_part_01
MHKFNEFVLNLHTCGHDRSIIERDYEKVIKEYRKAKQLISTDSTARPVYRKVWEEVVSLVSDLRASLLGTLTAAASTATSSGASMAINVSTVSFSQHQQPLWRTHLPAVKCLVQLDCPKNPVSHFLISHQQGILNELRTRLAAYQNRVSLALNRFDATATSEPQIAGAEDREQEAVAAAAAAREQVGSRTMQLYAAPCLEAMTQTLTTGIASWCDAATNLMPYSIVYDTERNRVRIGGRSDGENSEDFGSAGRPPIDVDEAAAAIAANLHSGDSPAPMQNMLGIAPMSTEVGAILSAGKAKQLLGELLRTAAQLYCRCCQQVLSGCASDRDENEDASVPVAKEFWSREVVTTIRRCHVEVQKTAVKYGVQWKYLKSLARLDEQTIYSYAQMRWQQAKTRVSALACAQCLYAAAGLSQIQRAPAAAAALGAAEFGVDVENAFDRYDHTASDAGTEIDGGDTCRIGIQATAAALDASLRMASKDLDLLFDRAVVDRAVFRRRLIRLLHDGIFAVIASFA